MPDLFEKAWGDSPDSAIFSLPAKELLAASEL